VVVLDDAVVLGGFGALVPADRCDTFGSGAGALVALTGEVLLAGEVLLTSAAKPLVAGDGSGRAGLGGAAW
jgi:hypothetical protein